MKQFLINLFTPPSVKAELSQLRKLIKEKRESNDYLLLQLNEVDYELMQAKDELRNAVWELEDKSFEISNLQDEVYDLELQVSNLEYEVYDIGNQHN